MTNIDRFAPLVAGVLIVCAILLGLIYTIGQRAECPTCSGRGVWMDELCSDCKGDAPDA